MPDAIKKLIQSISYLPGVWEKSATKLAFFLLNSNQNFLENFAKNLENIKKEIHNCHTCGSITDILRNECHICQNSAREKNTICIVEEYLDMLTIENTGGYTGVYHILGGAISPINGVFVWDLNIKKLFERIQASPGTVELILATNPNIEWEATTSYIKEEIEKLWLSYKVEITRLSRGLSAGYIEYADNLTLLNALKERKKI